MRQTELDEVDRVKPGRPSGRPDFLPQLRFDGKTADGAPCTAVVERDGVLLSRPLGGLDCRIRLRRDAFAGAALIRRGDTYAVRLLHREPGLSPDLVETASFGGAMDARDWIARLLRLPALFVAADGSVCGERRRLGGVVTADAAPRRPLRAARRPRFLARRRIGAEPAEGRIAGREIIARR